MITGCGLVLVVLALSDPGVPIKLSVEEAEKNIVERFQRIQSLTATITNEESQDDKGKTTSVVITRNIEWMRKGTRFLYRAETTTRTTEQDVAGSHTRQTTSTTVSDGDRVVRLAEQDGQVTAVQRRADVTVTPDVRAMFEVLRADNHLTRFPDVKVGIQDCYAIQVVPKVKKGSDLLQTMIYFQKDTGLDVRTVVYGRDNKPLFTSTTTNVRVNPEIPEDRFVIVVPDGVELIDETGR